MEGQRENSGLCPRRRVRNWRPRFGLGGWVSAKPDCVSFRLATRWLPKRSGSRYDQVVSVLHALEEEGYAPKNIAVLGDSAGGGHAAGAVLKMRDQGLGMPGAVVLWSPWADITETGDTAVTLKQRRSHCLTTRKSSKEGRGRLRRSQGPEASLRLAGLRRLFQGVSADPDPGRHQGDFPQRFRP